MKAQGLINEVFWLRCLACLAVTLGHAINNGYLLYVNPTIYNVGTYILYNAVLFGVPVFVFISEFLLAHKYLEKLPKGFMKRRIEILLLPYLFMSTVYALLNVDSWTIQQVIPAVANSIFLGKSSVYFILIIFQFYFLHLLISKYLKILSAKIALPLAFIINILYLAVFNFTEPANNSISQYIWQTGYWIPFVGWIFYFVLGFYCGMNYQDLLKFLRHKWLLIMPFMALLIMLLMNKYFLIKQDSKRIDMLFYASAVIFFIIYVSARMKRVPKIVMFISNHSFSIFLLNMFFLFYFVKSVQFIS